MHALFWFLAGLIAGVLVAYFYGFLSKRKTRKLKVTGLTFGLTSPRDLFGKLQRDASLLKDEVTSDRLFNFVITGYSMIDWIKNDLSVPRSAKAGRADLYGDRSLKVCGDLANGCKHFTLTRGTPVTSSATSARGHGMGRYGKGAYGVGEESIEIELNDGTKLNCLDLVQDVMSRWKSFFSAHGM